MTIGQAVFLSLLYQAPQETVVVFEKVQEPPDYSFIWFINTKTKEDVWMARYYRVNGLKYHGPLLWHTKDLLVEYFDFKYFKTDSEKEKIIAPDKKG